MITPTGTQQKRHSEKDAELYHLMEATFSDSPISLLDKLEAFPRFASKRSIARFLAKQKIFEKIIGINGIVVECGVFNAGGLFTWAMLSEIYEPTNYNRKIVGFDTFEGFPNVHKEDQNDIASPSVGELRGDTFDSISRSIYKHNHERYLSHIEKISLVRGDFMETSTLYLNANPHVLISLLYLDFDLYEPTCQALETFLPRMPKGAIVCFDELNCPNFPGETTALLEKVNIRTHCIERLPIDPWISWLVL
ncbi:dTDP-6-deoxy-L-hexose 3-O-methyltransferase [Azospirillaceae bacterium]